MTGAARPDAPSQLNRFIEAAPDAMIALDGRGCVVFANRRLREMFGFPAGTLLGEPVERLIPETYGTLRPNPIRDSLNAPHAQPLERGLTCVGRHADGGEFLVEVSLSAIDGAGEAVALAAIRDASARVAAESKVHRNEQLLSSLINGIVDYAVFMLDAGGCVLTWTNGAETIKGYSVDEIIGRNVAVFFTYEDQMAGVPQQILETARREGRFEGDGWRVRKDGSQFLAHVTMDAIRDETGAISGFAKLTRDITASRRSENLAREAERWALETARLAEEKDRLLLETERLRAIADAREQAALNLLKTSETLNALIAASPLGICMLNMDGVFEIWNPSCERIYGYDAEDVIGRDHKAVSDGLAIAGEAGVDEFWPSGPSHERVDREVRRRRRDGSIATVIVSLAPIQEAGGQPIGYVLIINDVTERKFVDQQLLHAQKMEAIGQLTGGVAHDFNNLLSIIICNLEFLIEDAPPQSETRECGQMALDASLRGAELVRHMLAFARKQTLESRIVQVNDLVMGMTNMLRRSLGEHIDIVLKTDPELWPSILDASQLQTALANLATNARDAMPGGGNLVIETANATLDEDYVRPFPDVAAGDYVMVSVSDSGRGMAPDVAARAFDPFFTTKGEGQGTGLGLSMVFGFVKQSSGHIDVYSEPGHGTTIKLYLPRAAPGPEEPAAPAEGAQPRDRFETILVVEDNVDLARSVDAMLRYAGYATIVVKDAATALQIIDGPDRVDLLFTDIILASGMSGIDLAIEAAARRPDLRILFTSGFAETALTANGKTIVNDRLLPKPYRMNDLLNKVAAFIDAP